MRDFKTILFATDFSESSANAFRYALTLAQKFDSRLVILHVINEPVDLRGFYVPHISFEKLEEEIEEGARKMMEKFCRSPCRASSEPPADSISEADGARDMERGALRGKSSKDKKLARKK
jgi:nucleotide-binding universal stress UspA family protein